MPDPRPAAKRLIRGGPRFWLIVALLLPAAACFAAADAVRSARVRIGAGMVRWAVAVLPPGEVRETLRQACAVWVALMRHRASSAGRRR